MKTLHAVSTSSDALKAVEEITEQLKSDDIQLLLYFASSSYDHNVLATALDCSFPGTQILGCSTAGELSSGRMLNKSLVAMAFSSKTVTKTVIQSVMDVAGDTRAATQAALARFEDELGCPMSELDPQKYVGLVLVDGLSGSEEQVMEAIGDATNVSFIGGSAGDDLKFQNTVLSHGTNVHSNAAVLAILETAAPFEIIKTQSFDIRPEKLVATKVDEANRCVIEFNNKPAAQAYAELLGTTAEKVSNFFMTNPLGLVVDGDAFVRSPMRLEEDKVYFYCSILEGMELSILESTDIVKDTAKALEKVKSPSALINFNCVLRKLELEQKGQEEDYGSLFSDIPTIGFHTYGEEYLGHINQTATMLAFHE